MSVDLRVQSRVPSLTQSWNRVGHPRTSLLLETPPRFKRSTTNIRLSVTMCMKIVVESDNRHLEQTAKSLCAQDTTLSRKYILSVSARPRRQMTAGTVISWHHQVRLKATCRNPFKPLFWTVCWIVVHTGHHIHQAHASWRRVYCVMLVCGPVGHTGEHLKVFIIWKRINCQVLYFGHIRTLAYVILACVDQSPNTGSHCRCLLDSRTEIT